MKNLIAVLLSGVWISLSEFIRNSWLLHDLWLEHYTKLGIIFPETPIHGMCWGIWSLMMAGFIWILLRKFNFISTLAISWTCGFAMMWLVIGNLGVLPYTILIPALPLSILESAVAVYIIFRFRKK